MHCRAPQRVFGFLLLLRKRKGIGPERVLLPHDATDRRCLRQLSSANKPGDTRYRGNSDYDYVDTLMFAAVCGRCRAATDTLKVPD